MIKQLLVRLGPDSSLLRAALYSFGKMRGFEIRFLNNLIQISRQSQAVILGKAQFVQVPMMLDVFEQYFSMFDASMIDGRSILDFSKPRMHVYRSSGQSFYFPSIPEEDQIKIYTKSYAPLPGEVVWDVGAHAGYTTFALSQMVGGNGKVYSFEPDDLNYEYLLRNIALQGLGNVIPVKRALAASTGRANFNMDGTMCAGLSDYLIYKDAEHCRTVPTISIEDACSEFGVVPSFIKMDIEGAEVAVVGGAKRFLKQAGIRFAIESHHRIQGRLTFVLLEQLFAEIGYKVHSSNEFGQMFTWAEPPY